MELTREAHEGGRQNVAREGLSNAKPRGNGDVVGRVGRFQVDDAHLVFMFYRCMKRRSRI